MIDEFRAHQLRALCAAMSFLAALVSPAASLGDDGESSSGGSSSGESSSGGSSSGESSSGGSSSGCIEWAPGISGWTSSSGGSSSSGSSSGISSGSSGSGSSGYPDTQPPSAPGGVVVSAITSSTAKIAWTASTDDLGVALYNVYTSPAGGSEPESVKVTDGCTHEITISELIPRTDYTFFVEAVDVAGNRTRSAPATATTADPAPFSLSVVPSTVHLVCGVDAQATVQISASADFTGTVDLTIRDPLWKGVTARFDPATTANTSTVTFSCEPPTTGWFGLMGFVKVVGSYGAQEATAQLTLSVSSSDASSSGGGPGSSSGAGSSSSSGGSSGGSSGAVSSSSSGGWSSGGGSGSSGGWSSGGGSGSSGGGSGSSGGWSSGSSSSGSSGGHGSCLPHVGCASGGGSEPGLLTLLPLLLTAVVSRRRGASRPMA